MKIVVIGGSGRVGANVVHRLVTHGHDPVPASPSTGVDTITGEGLADVMVGADAAVDVTNAPRWDDDAVRKFLSPRRATCWLLSVPPASSIIWRCRSSVVTGCPTAATAALLHRCAGNHCRVRDPVSARATRHPASGC
jgi:hypothetical protein